MEDYKEKLRLLLLAFYHPLTGVAKVERTTAELLEFFTGIIPSVIDQHDIYEVMTEESFEIIKTKESLKWVLYEMKL